MLNRVARWTPEGLEYEADPRQWEKLLRDFKLDSEGVKSVGSPGVKPIREQLDGDVPLGYSGRGKSEQTILLWTGQSCSSQLRRYAVGWLRPPRWPSEP